ncbi:MAG: hypothetical protein RL531_358, partial [Actinomycetota bacterium]
SSLGVLDATLPHDVAASTPAEHEVRNLVTVARTLVAAALARTESRGTHTRLDHPESDPAFRGRLVQVRGAEPFLAPLPVPVETP